MHFAKRRFSGFSVLFLLCSLLVISGCDAFGGNDSDPEIEGEYSFSTFLAGAETDFEGNLTQSGVSLSGTGTTSFTFQFDDGTSQSINVPSSISGNHNYPDVSITLTLEETENVPEEDWLIDGEANDDASRISGTLTFPSGDQRSIVMRRQ